jgi:valyl-tRNA synthetase
LNQAIDGIYRFLWDDYADWYVEYLKTDPTQLVFAKELYKQFVISASPFCPFECEVLWKDFFGETDLLASYVKDKEWSDRMLKSFLVEQELAKIPTAADNTENPIYLEFESVIKTISSIRSTKGLFGLDPVTSFEIYCYNPKVEKDQKYIQNMARVQVIIESKTELYCVKNGEFEYSLDIFAILKDLPAEIARTNKNIESLQKQINGLESRLNNPDFISKAEPENIQECKQNPN